MNAVLTITRRGTVTLPAKLREHLGIKAGDQFTIETTPDGILLRSNAIEIYSDERIREFEDSEAELATRHGRAVRKTGSYPT